MATIIDGKALAALVVEEVAKDVASFEKQYNIKPGLAAVLVGEDPSSQVYVSNTVLRANESGLNSIERRLPADADQVTLNKVVDELNRDPAVYGILVQLPLPEHLDEEYIINVITPAKDIDGFHPGSLVGAGR